MMNFDWTAVQQLKGFLDHEEGLRLYALAGEAARLGPCLEIGGYCGKSAVYIGTACREQGGALFSIDHHRGSEEQQPGEEYFDPGLFDVDTWAIDTLAYFRRTLGRAGLEEIVVPLVCRSQTAARAWATPLGLVFIDGGHAYESVSGDYKAWARHIVPGGYLVFHDIFPDPSQGGQAPRQVYEQAIESGAFTALPLFKTLGVLQRL
jgi:MMP 1-O-methyltransferase